MIFFNGKFKFNWETLLPSYNAVDVIDNNNYQYASGRLYSFSWLGLEICYQRKVNRPLIIAKYIEPWEWVDSIISYFRK